jgi:Uma2 family endonuclease
MSVHVSRHRFSVEGYSRMDDSVDFDREVKTPLYAASGIPELWIVDRRQRGDRISPASLPDLVLEVSAVLG